MFHVEHCGAVVAEDVSRHATSINIKLSPAQLDLISTYVDDLIVWSQKVNLTAITDPFELSIKHFLDSLYGAQLILSGEKSNLADIGSGAGFPGIPLKIVFPEIDLYLIEKNKKKASFLSYLIGKLRLERCRVVAKPINDVLADGTLRGHFRNIVVRAVRFNQIASAVSALMHRTGRAIIYTTEPLAGNQVIDPLIVSKTVAYNLPRGQGRRSLVLIEKVPRSHRQCSTWNMQAGDGSI